MLPFKAASGAIQRREKGKGELCIVMCDEQKMVSREEQRSKEADHQASVDVRPRLRFHKFGGWANINLIRNDTGVITVSKEGPSKTPRAGTPPRRGREVGCAFR